MKNVEGRLELWNMYNYIEGKKYEVCKMKYRTMKGRRMKGSILKVKN